MNIKDLIKRENCGKIAEEIQKKKQRIRKIYTAKAINELLTEEYIYNYKMNIDKDIDLIEAVHKFGENTSDTKLIDEEVIELVSKYASINGLSLSYRYHIDGIVFSVKANNENTLKRTK